MNTQERIVDRLPDDDNTKRIEANDSLSSILSPGDDESSSSCSTVSYQQQLAAQNAYRDVWLERIDAKKPTSLLRILRQREELVRKRRMVDDADTETVTLSEESATVWYDATEQEQEEVRKVAETEADIPCASLLLLERHTALPAMACLVLHCLAHVALYDAVEIVAEEFRKLCLWWAYPNALCLLGQFLAGVACMRASGYLYWWLNGTDYQCIKLDLHNRLRLGHVEARLLHWIKQRPALRAALCIVGYHLVYKVVLQVYELVYYRFVNESIYNVATPLSSHVDRCLQHGSAHVEEACAALRPMDDAWKASGMETSPIDYSLEDVLGLEVEEETGSLLSSSLPSTMQHSAWIFWVSLSVCATCIALMQLYGFRVYEKY